MKYADKLQRIEYSMVLLNAAFEESRIVKENKIILTELEVEKYKIVANLFELLGDENPAVSTSSAWALGWLSAARDEDTHGIWKLTEEEIQLLLSFITGDNSKVTGYATLWIYHILSADFQKWHYPDKETDLIYEWAVQLDNKLKELSINDDSTFSSAIEIKNNSDLCYQVMGKDTTGRVAWYFILVDKDKKEEFLEHRQGDSYDLADYGKIVASGYGEEVPDHVKDMLRNKYGFDNF
jgi:hypothetical protein